MRGVLSKIPFAALLKTKVDICAVIVPSDGPQVRSLPRHLAPQQPPPSVLPLLTPYRHESIIHLAWQHDIPVWEVGGLRGQKTLALLAAFQPDLICVACFPYIFPPTLLQGPAYGCLNLHPSLLPAYRGPTPLFWLMRQGERKSGVTLHFLAEGIDSGDIVSQTTFTLPDGISEAALTERCAIEGGALLVALVERLKTAPLDALPRSPQVEAERSYYPAPAEADFYIPTTWPARRAFNFLRGANTWPLKIDLGEDILAVEAALGYDNSQTLSDGDKGYAQDEAEIRIQFTPGVLRVRGGIIING